MTASGKKHPGSGEPPRSRGDEPEGAGAAFVPEESVARGPPAGDVASTIAELESENEALSLQLTGLVREVGELKFYVDRVASLEFELRARDERIRQLESEVARLDGALVSGRPTALAAAAAANRLPQAGESSPRVARMLARATAAVSPGAAAGPEVGAGPAAPVRSPRRGKRALKRRD